MIDKFSELLNRPGVERAISTLVEKEEQEHDHRKDKERDRLRREAEKIQAALAVELQPYVAKVKELECDVQEKKRALADAQRSLFRANHDLSQHRGRLGRKLAKIEKEIALRPIGPINQLRQKLFSALRTIGAPPRHGFEKHPDSSWYRRCERLGSIGRELDIYEKTSAATVLKNRERLEKEIADALRN